MACGQWPDRRASDSGAVLAADRSYWLDIMGVRILVQRLIMDQRGFGSERHRLAVAERPFAAVAIRRRDIAIDIEAALVISPVSA